MATSDCFSPTRSRGPARAERRARDQALEILHALQGVAEFAAIGRAERKLLDGVESIADAFERTSGRSSHARSSRPPIDGHRAIELVSSVPVAAAIGRFDESRDA